MATASAKNEWVAGWPLLLSCVVGMSTTTVAQYSLGQFMAPLEHAFGWSRTEVSSGLSVAFVVSIFLGPLVGRAADVMNARILAIVGLTLTGLTVASFSLANGNLPFWVALWVAYILCANLVAPVLWLSVIPAVFQVNKNLATAIALAGISLAMAFAPSLSRYLIDVYGWQNAFRFLALIWFGLATALALAFFFDRRPGRSKSAPEVKTVSQDRMPLRGIFLSVAFFKLAFVVFAGMATLFAYGIHLSPALVDKGFSPGDAAKLAGITGITAILGKLAVGWLFDRLPFVVVTTGIMAIVAIASALLLSLHGQVLWAIAACVALGLATGAMLTAIACVTRQLFPAGQFGLIFGALTSVMALAAAVGPTAASFIRDEFGSYDMFYWIGLGSAGLSVLVLKTFKPANHLSEPVAVTMK
jgi:MFS family permease